MKEVLLQVMWATLGCFSTPKASPDCDPPLLLLLYKCGDGLAVTMHKKAASAGRRGPGGRGSGCWKALLNRTSSASWSFSCFRHTRGREIYLAETTVIVESLGWDVSIFKEYGILVPISQVEEAGIRKTEGLVEVHAVQSKDLSPWLLDSEVSAIKFVDSFIQLRLNSYVIEAGVLLALPRLKAVNLHCPPFLPGMPLLRGWVVLGCRWEFILKLFSVKL